MSFQRPPELFDFPLRLWSRQPRVALGVAWIVLYKKFQYFPHYRPLTRSKAGVYHREFSPLALCDSGTVVGCEAAKQFLEVVFCVLRLLQGRGQKDGYQDACIQRIWPQKSSRYAILAERAVPDGTILRDEEIVLLSEKNHADPMRLRRIEVWVEEKQDTLVFVTNHPKLRED